MNSRDMDGLKIAEIYIVVKNVGLQPLYNMNKYNVKNYKNGKSRDDITS